MLAFLLKIGYNRYINIREAREWEQIPLSIFWKINIKEGNDGKSWQVLKKKLKN